MVELSSEQRHFTEFLLDRYRERTDRKWDELRTEAEQTTAVVRHLAGALVNTRDRIGDQELTALFRCCQHNEVQSTESKKNQIRDLDLPPDDVDPILSQITEDIGSVGGQNFTLYVGGQEVDSPEVERALYSCFETLLDESATVEDHLDAVSELSQLEYHSVQSGRMSPILHYLNPTEFPINNGVTRSGMKRYFGYDIDAGLNRYLDEREKYLEVRDEFGFNEHFRDLDWFCYWADHDNLWTRALRNDSKREVWQAQPGTNAYGIPEVLWPEWRDRDVISVGFMVTEDELDSGEEQHPQAKNIMRRMAPGDIVVAKGGHHDLLGFGVVTDGGYEHRAEADRIQFSKGGSSEYHQHVRYVDWIYTRDVEDAIQVDELEVSRQFDNRTIVRYKSFNELRAKLTASLGSSMLATFTELEEQSIAYLSQDTDEDEAPVTKDLDPAGEYEGVVAATEDVLDRLGRTDESNPLAAELLKDTILEWTDVLRRSRLVGGTVASKDVPVLEEIVDLYQNTEARLEELAARLGVGTLNGFPPKQVLFIGLVRDLQDAANDRNFNQVKLNILLTGDLRSASLETRAEPPNHGETIERQLSRTKQMVFHGPPGTGKTYTALEFARWWLGKECDDPTDDQLGVITFHPSFTYEDFIEGLTAKEQDGAVAYRIQNGVFKQFCRRATDAYEEHTEAGNPGPAPPYVLVIDEINRGNLAQIFGEVITLLEADKRIDARSETTTTLPHSNEDFAVPPNLYVIGTMNTADRSIALVDAALRRRFRFLHFPPDPNVLYDEYGIVGEGELKRLAADSDSPAGALLALSILALDHLNESIRAAPQLGRGKQLGHSYLLGIDRDADPREQVQTIVDKWRFEILPLLEEYYFGQFGEIETTLFDGDAGPLLNTDAQEIGDFTGNELADALVDLVDVGTIDWQPPSTQAGLPRESTDTLDFLYDAGALNVGDELHFTIEKLPDGVAESFASDDSYWRAEATGNDGEQNDVRWLHDDELYSISGLSRHIFEDLTGDVKQGMSGPEWWRLPPHERYTLYELRTAITDGTITVDDDLTDGSTDQ